MIIILIILGGCESKKVEGLWINLLIEKIVSVDNVKIIVYTVLFSVKTTDRQTSRSSTWID